MLSPEQYAIERAICDKADAFWKANAYRHRDGSSSLAGLETQHPDWLACNNAMRGRVELYELHRDRPATFSAYVTNDGTVTTWPGDVIGKVFSRSALGRGWTWRMISVRTEWGDVYRGREYASMQLVTLRRV